jgi:hypothetical protein
MTSRAFDMPGASSPQAPYPARRAAPLSCMS